MTDQTQIYTWAAGTAVNDGFVQNVGYPSGNVSVEQTLPGLGTINQIGPNPGAKALTDGGVLVYAVTNSNSVVIGAIRAFDLTYLNSFGVSSGTTTPSDATRILAPFAMAPIRSGLTDYVVACAGAFNIGEVCVLTVPGLANVNLGRCDEQSKVVLGRGNTGNTSGNAWAMATPTNSATPVGIYKVAPNSLTKIGTLSPAQVDATWTHFVGTNGIVGDQTDGNVLVIIGTTDAVTNQHYILKLNGATGALMWKIPVNVVNADSDVNFGKCSVKNGTLYYLGSTNLLYKINTIAGTVTTQTIDALSTVNGQFSEDTFNSLFLYATWAQGVTTPNYIGTYMADEGHHTLGGQWARFFPAASGNPSLMAYMPPTQVTGTIDNTTALLGFTPVPVARSVPIVSTNRAWTFTLDGHTFYVLDIGAEGTFLYDFQTSEWSNFATGALATDGSANPQWNAINGLMWNQRIVAGDLTTGDVWETAPSAVLDNGATEIGHASTGGVQTRSRDFISCDAVRISASFGLLDEVAGVAFNLRYSDDQGKTWSGYFTIELAEGDYGSEIAWRSLGSFCAPGRIFELSDSGGLIRIDGMDVFTDGFDNTGEKPGGS